MKKIISLLIIFFSFKSVEIHATEKLPVYGDYFLEIEDPHHRHIHFLRPEYQRWLKEGSSIVGNFWEYLEMNREYLQVQSPALYDPEFHMAWLDEDQRREYAATFHTDDEGRVAIMTPLYGMLSDGKWMYVQMDGEFFVGLERKFQFHHTSLSGGRPVESAGTFTIKDGSLAKISLVSGHYRPKVKHGMQCLEGLGALGVNVDGFEMTYCVMQEEMVIKRRVTVEQFRTEASDAADPSMTKFFIPLHEAVGLSVDKAELFLTAEETFWLGNSKLKESDPLCTGAAPFLLTASVKLHQGRITHLIFNTQIELESDLEKMKNYIHLLIGQGIDVSDIRFRIIRDHEKVTVGYQEILELPSVFDPAKDIIGA